jgi:hypothetical protein
MIWDLHCHLTGPGGRTPDEAMARLIGLADRMGATRQGARGRHRRGRPPAHPRREPPSPHDADPGREGGQAMIDVNVWLSRWPFRRLPDDEPAALVRRLRRPGVTAAWAGSLDAPLHHDLADVNARLVAMCRAYGADPHAKAQSLPRRPQRGAGRATGRLSSTRTSVAMMTALEEMSDSAGKRPPTSSPSRSNQSAMSPSLTSVGADLLQV